MSKDDAKKKIDFQHAGDHHQVNMAIDPKTGKITGGIVSNFSNNSAIALSVDEESKVQGTVVHSGDTHAFQANVRSDGSFDGVYFDRKKGIQLEISGDKATLIEGKVPQAGLTIKGEHHNTVLEIDKNGQVSGVLESKATRDGKFKIEMKDGKISGGSFEHVGKNHKTELSMGQDGWKAQISGGSRNSAWSIGIVQGKAETKIGSGFKMKF
ncbi:MAG TPA: hypothetical protein DCX95_02425 [Elusimicrobia bacterium]|nr:hypothetical protein [Elusimicrobiota bacterium]